MQQAQDQDMFFSVMQWGAFKAKLFFSPCKFHMNAKMDCWARNCNRVKITYTHTLIEEISFRYLASQKPTPFNFR